MYDIITVGSNTLDVFVATDAKLIKIHKPNTSFKDNKNELCLAYPLGEKILITKLDFQTGGGGTNTAASFSRLGFKTGYLGKIGHDESGLKIFNGIHKENIDFLGTFGKSSGYSVILDAKINDRTILTHKGCNDDLTFNEIDFKKIKTKWFYFSSMMGKSFITLKKLSKYASSKKISITFNPSFYLAEKGLKELKTILDATNILVLNFEEAMLLSGKKTMNDCLFTLKKAVKDIVVVTNGAKGVCAYDGEFIYELKAQAKLKIVETTGAGDAFASAFTAGLMKKRSLEDSLKIGMNQAESVIRMHGAKNNLLSWNKLMAKLNKDKRKILKKKMVR